MSEKFRDMLGASSMILMMVAVVILGLGIKNILTVLPASAYEDKGVHTFTPIEIYPVQKKNTSSYGRSRRMHPTTTVYKVRYEATDGSGYRCSFEAGSTETSAQLLAEKGPPASEVVMLRAQGYSYAEIAARIRITENSARVMEHRTRTWLKSMLQKEGLWND